ncbi:MAG TPA: DUF4142 domain-containing protein, partial [Vicinamibacteria bacterium]
MRTNGNTALLAAGLLVWGGMAAAQATATRPAPGVSAAHTFMVKAAQANMAEVALGKLAAEKGQSDEVKRYGQHMV